MTSPQDEQRPIRQYWVITLLTRAADRLFGSLYVGFMAANGLTNTQVGSALSFSSLSLAILDYPSGNVADVLGRKRTMGLGMIIWGVSLFAFGRSHSLLQFFCVMGLWTLGVSLVSGVPQSWLVDELFRLGKPELRKTVFPYSNTAALVIGAIAALSSKWLIARSHDLPFTVAAAILCLTGSYALLACRENYGSKGAIGKAVVQSTQFLIRNSTMRLLLLRSACARIAFQVFVVIWQLQALQRLRLELRDLGPLSAALMLALALGNGLAVPAMRRIKPINVSILGQAIVGVGSLILVLDRGLYLFVLAAVLFEIGLGLDSGSSRVWEHDFIPSDKRASIVSALSSAGSLVGIVTPTLVGYMSQRASFSPVWALAFCSSLGTIAILRAIIESAHRTSSVT